MRKSNTSRRSFMTKTAAAAAAVSLSTAFVKKASANDRIGIVQYFRPEPRLIE